MHFCDRLLQPLAHWCSSQRPIQQDFQVGRNKEAFLSPQPLIPEEGHLFILQPNSFRVLGETNVTLSNSGVTWLSLAVAGPLSGFKDVPLLSLTASVFGLNLLPFVCPDITPGLPTNTKIMLAKGLGMILEFTALGTWLPRNDSSLRQGISPYRFVIGIINAFNGKIITKRGEQR